MRPTHLAPVAAALTTIALAGCGGGKVVTDGPGPTTSTPPARLSLVAGGGEAKGALAPQPATHYVLDGPLADLGTSAPARKFVAHEVTAAEVARIATALGLHGEATRTDAGYEVRDGDALLQIETPGGTTSIDYSSTGNAPGGSVSGSPGGSPGGAPVTPVPPVAPVAPVPTLPPVVDLPDAAGATTIARTTLDDFGVLDGAQWATEVSESTTGVAVSCPAGTTCPVPAIEEITARTVTFDRVIDGTRVPDVGWSVTVGSHGRVESVSGTWGQVVDAGTYELRSTAAVFDDLQHGRAQFVGAQPLAASAEPDQPAPAPTTLAPPDSHVTGVALGFARWDGVDGGEPVVYLVPTYRFHTRLADEPASDVEVLALDPAGFTITGPVGVGSAG